MKKYTNIIIIAALAGFFMVFNLFLWKKFSDKKNYLWLQNVELDKKIELAEKIESAEKELDSLSRNLFSDFFGFKQMIEKSALEQGVTIRSVKPFSAIRDEAFPEIKANLELECAYGELVRFLSIMEENSMIGIERAILGAKTANAESLEISLTLIGFGK